MAALIGAVCWSGTIQKAEASIPVISVTELAQSVSHQATTFANWAEEKLEWISSQLTWIDQLVELITNNFLTKAIRGFNELMTAIQTDISDVLGTIETLAAAPTEILDSIMGTVGSVTGAIGSVMELPKTIYGMLSAIPSEFKGIYDSVLSSFDVIGDAQALGKDISGAFSGSGGAWSLLNKMGGMRTRLNSGYLQGSRGRETKVRQWGAKAKYGKDQSQLLSTGIDVQLETLRQQYRQEEMRAMDRLYEAAERVAQDQIYRSRTAKTVTQTGNWFTSQLNF